MAHPVARTDMDRIRDEKGADAMLPTHQEDRALFQALSSKNYDFVVAGAMALWKLLGDSEDVWILKDDMIAGTVSMLGEFGIAESEYDPEEYEEEGPSIQDDSDFAKVKAGYVYRLLRDKGWFEEVPERIRGRLVTTINVDETAAALAGFVASLYDARMADRSSCVFAAKAVLEKASSTLASARADGSLSDPATARKVGGELLSAVRTCRERGERLNIRLRTAAHSYRKRSRELISVADVRSLSMVLDNDYRKNLFEEILWPLRVEDGYERFAPGIVRVLDSWNGDPQVRSLMAGAADSAQPDVDVFLDFLNAREAYAKKLKVGVAAVGRLDIKFIDDVRRRYGVLAGSVSKRAARLEKVLLRLAEDNGRVAFVAGDAFGRAVGVAGVDAFRDSGISVPRKVERGEGDYSVEVSFSDERADGPWEYSTARSRATRRMEEKLDSHEGFFDVADDPPSCKDDVVWVLDAIMAADAGAPFVVGCIDDERRIENGTVSMPSVSFVKRG